MQIFNNKHRIIFIPTVVAENLFFICSIGNYFIDIKLKKILLIDYNRISFLHIIYTLFYTLFIIIKTEAVYTI